ncbi:MAG: hypothetical protein WA231_17485, partial [Methylocella sp.]
HAREIAAKPDPLTLKDKRAVNTFIEIVGALGPRLQTLRNRAKGDWAAEIRLRRIGRRRRRGRRLLNRQMMRRLTSLLQKRRSQV